MTSMASVVFMVFMVRCPTGLCLWVAIIHVKHAILLLLLLLLLLLPAGMPAPSRCSMSRHHLLLLQLPLPLALPMLLLLEMRSACLLAVVSMVVVVAVVVVRRCGQVGMPLLFLLVVPHMYCTSQAPTQLLQALSMCGAGQPRHLLRRALQYRLYRIRHLAGLQLRGEAPGSRHVHNRHLQRFGQKLRGTGVHCPRSQAHPQQVQVLEVQLSCDQARHRARALLLSLARPRTTCRRPCCCCCSCPRSCRQACRPRKRLQTPHGSSQVRAALLAAGRHQVHQGPRTP
mmetsp:Transcript_19905/g.43324  ORF Transcript_19905/g.43324 Transcript_19905/m.43324 type:complete len:286 (+) Transcript_19905:254-1111(+)